MSEASRSVVGEPLALSSIGTGFDEFTDDRPHVIQDFLRWQQSPRSEGYLRRLSSHEERFGVVTNSFANKSFQDATSEFQFAIIQNALTQSNGKLTDAA